MRRTKIIATLGPATTSPEQVGRLVDAGMDAARLNCAHEKREGLAGRVAAVREAAEKRGRAVATIADLAGPKMRTGSVPAGGVALERDARFLITTRDVPGSADVVSTNYRELARDVREGDAILLDDGLLRLRVIRADETDVTARVEVGGRLFSRKGLNLPGLELSGPSFTGKDRRDLEAAVAAGVDYIAISYIRKARDVVRVRTLLNELGHGDMPLIAKIERPEAVHNLDGILRVAEGVMVARGDLAVETSAERVPLIQKRIIREANARGRIAITATQMLDSMTSNPLPTRAEASDVANAILDGSDAVMLSGETAVGRYPIQAVRTIERFASYTERHADISTHPRYRVLIDRRRVEYAVSAAAREAAVAVDAVCIVAFTESGATVRHVSRMRPPCGILGFTPSEKVYRRLALRYGVRPMRNRLYSTTDAMLAAALERVKTGGFAATDDRVVLVCGTIQLGGATNMMKIETV